MPSEDAISRSEVDNLLKAQQSAFEGFLRVYMDSVNARVDSIFTQVLEVKSSLVNVNERLNTLSCKDEDLLNTVTSLQDNFKDVVKQADYLENQSRRNNLRFDGIPEDPRETWTETELKVKDTLVTTLGFSVTEASNIKIERAHRTGKNLPLHRTRAPGGAPNHTARSVVVKFNSFKDREAILRRCKDRRPIGLFVNEDFSKRVVEIRNSHLPDLKRYKEQGKIAYLSYDKLIVRDQPQSTPGSQQASSHSTNQSSTQD